MKPIVVAVLGTALSLAGCSEPVDPAAPSDPDVMLNDSGVAVDMANPQGFASTLAAANAFAVASADLAADRAQSARVKDFAARMASEHREATENLRVALARIEKPPAATARLGIEAKGVLDNLRTKRGADFDMAYRMALIDSHRRTLDYLNRYINDPASDPALVEYARKRVPALGAHLNLAEGLD